MIASYLVVQQQVNARDCYTSLDSMKLPRAKPLIDKKTHFFLARIRDQRLEKQYNSCYARVMANCDRYLGLPVACGKSKVNTFKDL